MRGNAVHRFLHLVSLEQDLADSRIVAEVITDLAAQGRLQPAEAKLINPEVVARFFATDLGQMILAAGTQVEREVPFALALPEQTAWGDEDLIVVRGIIDMILPSPQGLVIVDFKTDNVAPEDVPYYAQRYLAQVRYYAQGLTRIPKAP